MISCFKTIDVFRDPKTKSNELLDLCIEVHKKKLQQKMWKLFFMITAFFKY